VLKYILNSTLWPRNCIELDNYDCFYLRYTRSKNGAWSWCWIDVNGSKNEKRKWACPASTVAYGTTVSYGVDIAKCHRNSESLWRRETSPTVGYGATVVYGPVTNFLIDVTKKHGGVPFHNLINLGRTRSDFLAIETSFWWRNINILLFLSIVIPFQFSWIIHLIVIWFAKQCAASLLCFPLVVWNSNNGIVHVYLFVG